MAWFLVERRKAIGEILMVQRPGLPPGQ